MPISVKSYNLYYIVKNILAESLLNVLTILYVNSVNSFYPSRGDLSAVEPGDMFREDENSSFIETTLLASCC